MRRLTGLDSLFLSLESPTNLLHVGAIAVLDPSTAALGAAAPYEAVRQVLHDRLHLLPPFRRRLVNVPGGLDHGCWIEDEDFQLDNHVRRGAVPSPGGELELAAFAAEVLSRPLDRDRPLWELHVVEGLRSGHVAAVTKIHHSAIDGLSGVELTCNLMDLSPETSPASLAAEPWDPDPMPSRTALTALAFARMARRLPVALSTAAVGGSTALRLRRLNRQAGAAESPPRPFASPATSFNKRLGRRRSVGMSIVDRADVERVRGAAGVTVNDVILALTGTALRAQLEERGEVLGRALVGFVPVAKPSEVAGRLDRSVNELSGMLVSLATTIDDPVARLMAVSESGRRAKAQDQVIGSGVVGALAELAIPSLAGPVARLLAASGTLLGRPPFNVVVSSFPGSPVPLYCAGSRLVAFYPFGPVVDGAALNVTATSHEDHIGFGLLADADALPDVGELAARLPEALTELVKAVGRGRR